MIKMFINGIIITIAIMILIFGMGFNDTLFTFISGIILGFELKYLCDIFLKGGIK
jgi:hypothetical protein